MINTVECIDRLRLVINTLTAEKADPASIVAALTELTIKAAEQDHIHAIAHMEAAAALLSIAAQNINNPRFFQQLSSTPRITCNFPFLLLFYDRRN